MEQTAQEMKMCSKPLARSAGFGYDGRISASIFSLLMAIPQTVGRLYPKGRELANSIARVCSIACVVSLTACAQQQFDQFNKDMANLNAALAGGTASTVRTSSAPVALAQNSDTGKGASTQLVIPTDKTTAAALDGALPTIKKVIALHQCMTDPSGARLFAPYAVAGGENNVFSYGFYRYAPIYAAKYHDKSKCVSVRAIDQVSLLALNSLQIRVVYLAEDSGEASNFQMQFMKASDASWRVSRISPLE